MCVFHCLSPPSHPRMRRPPPSHSPKSPTLDERHGHPQLAKLLCCVTVRLYRCFENDVSISNRPENCRSVTITLRASAPHSVENTQSLCTLPVPSASRRLRLSVPALAYLLSHRRNLVEEDAHFLETTTYSLRLVFGERRCVACARSLIHTGFSSSVWCTLSLSFENVALLTSQPSAARRGAICIRAGSSQWRRGERCVAACTP
jgi:hypothetical protein